MNKTLAVLYIYDLLLSKKKFQTTDLTEKFGCSLRTVKRHIQSVKKYISIYHPEKTIKYSAKEKSYFLVAKED